ncbi:PIN domain-containing protein [Parafrankia elaeagni]|uniref:PIN domain-containing protein n=1 Tax=Parafrankia elaeagni TaxID=222534 RepID=UPI00039C95D1|nr:PIN domain-containing protein [Parafrankia elaeagni]
MAFTVVYDANVLYPNTLRDLLIRIAQSGLIQAKWTNEILDEMLTAIRRNRPEISVEKRDRLRGLMNASVRDVLVSGYEPLIDGLKLPDPDDRHVLAAAVKAGAQVIVTRNLKDFPAADLEPWARGGAVARCLRAGPAEHQRTGGGGSDPTDRGLPHEAAGVRRRRPAATRT